jgi:hypothetical protein
MLIVSSAESNLKFNREGFTRVSMARVGDMVKSALKRCAPSYGTGSPIACGSGFSAVAATGYYGEVGPAAMIAARCRSHTKQKYKQSTFLEGHFLRCASSAMALYE